MVNELLNNIPTLLSRRFFLTGLLPVTLFAFGSTIMIYMLFPWGNETYLRLLELEGGNFWIATTFTGLGLIVITFVFDGIMRGFGRWLEGTRPWGWIRAWMLVERHTLFQDARNALNDVRAAARDLMVDKWKTNLRTARYAGRREPCTYDEEHATHDLINTLEAAEFARELLVVEDIEQAVVDLDEVLSKNSADHKKDVCSSLLDRDHVRLLRIIESTRSRYDSRIRELYLALQDEYPVHPTATEFGQIAASVQAYASTRYGILDFLWPRLQRVIQTDDTFLQTLQEAKLRVDYFVALLFVTALFTAVWLPILAVIAYEPIIVGLVGLVGPLLCLLWYRLATSSNKVFSEVARSGIDLFRLDLLDRLGIKAPTTLGEEKELWEKISRHIGYEEAHTLDYKEM